MIMKQFHNKKFSLTCQYVKLFQSNFQTLERAFSLQVIMMMVLGLGRCQVDLQEHPFMVITFGKCPQ